MDFLRTLFANVLSLAAIVVAAIMITAAMSTFAQLLKSFPIYFHKIQLYFQSAYSGPNRPAFSGLAFTVVYFGTKPFVFECVGGVIWAIMLYMIALGETHSLPLYLYFIVLNLLGTHALRNLGGPVRALLNDHCEKLARAYRWDRLLRLDTLPPRESQNDWAKAVMYVADRVHIYFAGASWEDVLLEEFQRDNILRTRPETFKDLHEEVTISGGHLKPEWRNSSFADETFTQSTEENMEPCFRFLAVVKVIGFTQTNELPRLLADTEMGV
ncbi:hypothetical protein K449DRAFT_434618 [Hypoxylon sp. EC38]|nr:hypothetical protein K449DRAFT_434618 [Hypoxylon sp. EC38]